MDVHVNVEFGDPVGFELPDVGLQLKNGSYSHMVVFGVLVQGFLVKGKKR